MTIEQSQPFDLEVFKAEFAQLMREYAELFFKRSHSKIIHEDEFERVERKIENFFVGQEVPLKQEGSFLLAAFEKIDQDFMKFCLEEIPRGMNLWDHLVAQRIKRKIEEATAPLNEGLKKIGKKFEKTTDMLSKRRENIKVMLNEMDDENPTTPG